MNKIDARKVVAESENKAMKYDINQFYNTSELKSHDDVRYHLGRWIKKTVQNPKPFGAVFDLQNKLIVSRQRCRELRTELEERDMIIDEHERKKARELDAKDDRYDELLTRCEEWKEKYEHL